jgi:hypothetical protein
MIYTATLTVARWPDEGPFFFASDDGETFYEMSRLSEDEAAYAHLRPFGDPVESEGHTYLRMGADKRWLQMQASDGGEVVFGTIA